MAENRTTGTLHYKEYYVAIGYASAEAMWRLLGYNTVNHMLPSIQIILLEKLKELHIRTLSFTRGTVSKWKLFHV